MRKSDKGFTLLEVLISFSIVILLTAFILPAFTLLLVERKNNTAQHAANVLLQEKMHEYMLNRAVTEEKDVINGVEYVVSWDEVSISIEWTDLLGRKKRKGRTISEY
ncbi:competence type IV pilus minor pilin ComGE [Priestia taiwanensis]|uniref:Prepilin-type N-terminal cleavage/methylation domain-containing protein n=1 Tax=Priestia taiwanensis TaxID=1347902 RepID=A0A917ATX3_9BACI|nr:competence type IV pilus minor pilin ComGE [Priestia taiwanensis]MBM7363813.1 competence protein ComGE [Priestia taiwanensis]GGE73904.1 hypothetical protein GCM10007140_24730 [Priestia taiwanensis]